MEATEAFNTTPLHGNRIQVLGQTCRKVKPHAPVNTELVLIRGLPGAGKSTMAKVLALVGYVHFEADMFFVKDGTYCYDRTRIRDAHAWCQNMTREALRAGQRTVVSNTFTQRREIEPYLQMSRNVRIIEARGTWPNEHGVPDETLRVMAERWEEISA